MPAHRHQHLRPEPARQQVAAHPHDAQVAHHVALVGEPVHGQRERSLHVQVAVAERAPQDADGARAAQRHERAVVAVLEPRQRGRRRVRQQGRQVDRLLARGLGAGRRHRRLVRIQQRAAVAHRVDVRVRHAGQVPVDDDLVVAVQRHVQAGAERRPLHAGRPHGDRGGEHAAVRRRHFVRAHLGDRRVRADLDTHRAQLAHGQVRRLRIQRRQHLRSPLDDADVHLVRRFQPREAVVGERVDGVAQVGGQFDARRAGADDDDVQQRRAGVRAGVAAPSRLGAQAEEALAERLGPRHAVQRQAVFLRARDAEEVRDRAVGQHEALVIDDGVRGRAVVEPAAHRQRAARAVHVDHFAADEREVVVDGLARMVDHVAGRVDGAGGDGMQQRFPEVRGRAVDEDHAIPVAGAEPAAQAGGEFEAGDAAPDDDDGLHGVLPSFFESGELAHAIAHDGRYGRAYPDAGGAGGRDGARRRGHGQRLVRLYAQLVQHDGIGGLVAARLEIGARQHDGKDVVGGVAEAAAQLFAGLFVRQFGDQGARQAVFDRLVQQALGVGREVPRGTGRFQLQTVAGVDARRPSPERVARGGSDARDAARGVASPEADGGDGRRTAHAAPGPQHPDDGRGRTAGGVRGAHLGPMGGGGRRDRGAEGRYVRHAAHRRGDDGGAPAAADARALHDGAPARAHQAAGGVAAGGDRHAVARRDRPRHHGHAAARIPHEREPLRAPPDGVLRRARPPAAGPGRRHAGRHRRPQPARARTGLGHARRDRTALRGRGRGARDRLRAVQQRGDQADDRGGPRRRVPVRPCVHAGSAQPAAGRAAGARRRRAGRVARDAQGGARDSHGGGIVPRIHGRARAAGHLGRARKYRLEVKVDIYYVYVPYMEYMMGIVNIEDELHDQIRKASTVSCRSINAQAAFWVRIGMLWRHDEAAGGNRADGGGRQAAGGRVRAAGPIAPRRHVDDAGERPGRRLHRAHAGRAPGQQGPVRLRVRAERVAQRRRVPRRAVAGGGAAERGHRQLRHHAGKGRLHRRLQQDVPRRRRGGAGKTTRAGDVRGDVERHPRRASRCAAGRRGPCDRAPRTPPWLRGRARILRARHRPRDARAAAGAALGPPAHGPRAARRDGVHDRTDAQRGPRDGAHGGRRLDRAHVRRGALGAVRAYGGRHAQRRARADAAGRREDAGLTGTRRFRRGGRFLDQRRVLHRHLVQVRDRAVHAADVGLLRLGGAADAVHDLADAVHAVDDLADRLARVADERRARAHLCHRILDQRLDLFRRGRRAVRQVAHLARDDRETASLFAGARRFHGRVQRQDIGLERDAVDDGNDVDDLARRLVDQVHRGDHLVDGGAAFDRDGRRRAGQHARLARVIRVLVHGGDQLRHRARHLLQRRGLRLRAAGQVVVPARDLRRGRRDRLRARPDLGDDVRQAVAHRVHRVDHARRPRARDVHLAGQLAAGDGARHCRGLGRFAAQLADQAAHDHDADRAAQRDRHDAERRDPVARALRRGAGGGARRGVVVLDALEQHVHVGDDLAPQRTAFVDEELAVAIHVRRGAVGARAVQLGGHFQHAGLHLCVLRIAAERGVQLAERRQVVGLEGVDEGQFARGGRIVLEHVGVAGRDAGLGERFARRVQRFEFAVAHVVRPLQRAVDAVDAGDREDRHAQRDRQDEGESDVQLGRDADAFQEIHYVSGGSAAKKANTATRVPALVPSLSAGRRAIDVWRSHGCAPVPVGSAVPVPGGRGRRRPARRFRARPCRRARTGLRHAARRAAPARRARGRPRPARTGRAAGRSERRLLPAARPGPGAGRRAARRAGRPRRARRRAAGQGDAGPCLRTLEIRARPAGRAPPDRQRRAPRGQHAGHLSAHAGARHAGPAGGRRRQHGERPGARDAGRDAGARGRRSGRVVDGLARARAAAGGRGQRPRRAGPRRRIAAPRAGARDPRAAGARAAGGVCDGRARRPAAARGGRAAGGRGPARAARCEGTAGRAAGAPGGDVRAGAPLRRSGTGRTQGAAHRARGGRRACGPGRVVPGRHRRHLLAQHRRGPDHGRAGAGGAGAGRPVRAAAAAVRPRAEPGGRGRRGADGVREGGGRVAGRLAQGKAARPLGAAGGDHAWRGRRDRAAVPARGEGEQGAAAQERRAVPPEHARLADGTLQPALLLRAGRAAPPPRDARGRAARRRGRARGRRVPADGRRPLQVHQRHAGPRRRRRRAEDGRCTPGRHPARRGRADPLGRGGIPRVAARRGRRRGPPRVRARTRGCGRVTRRRVQARARRDDLHRLLPEAAGGGRRRSGLGATGPPGRPVPVRGQDGRPQPGRRHRRRRRPRAARDRGGRRGPRAGRRRRPTGTGGRARAGRCAERIEEDAVAVVVGAERERRERRVRHDAEVLPGRRARRRIIRQRGRRHAVVQRGRQVDRAHVAGAADPDAERVDGVRERERRRVRRREEDGLRAVADNEIGRAEKARAKGHARAAERHRGEVDLRVRARRGRLEAFERQRTARRRQERGFVRVHRRGLRRARRSGEDGRRRQVSELSHVVFLHYVLVLRTMQHPCH
ncbi:hypothetical protein Lal_00014941 [Lupinus albus]|nr:hypothetical protein Lal_00014941 [Lupinus albus]